MKGIMKLNKQRIFIIILGILLVLVIGYILFGMYGNWKQKKNMDFFEQGVKYGFEQAIIQLSQRAMTCQQIPLIVENQTINLIAVDCLEVSPEREGNVY